MKIIENLSFHIMITVKIFNNYDVLYYYTSNTCTYRLKFNLSFISHCGFLPNLNQIIYKNCLCLP